MKTHVAFRSSAFPKYENEDAEIVNPTRWGKRLAEFVRDNLPAYGIETEGILCEDWGWLVNTKCAEFPLWIGCGPVEDRSEPENVEEGLAIQTLGTQEDSSEITEFCMFVAAEPGLLKKLFKRVDTGPAVTEVAAALEKMLSDREEFQDVAWTP